MSSSGPCPRCGGYYWMASWREGGKVRNVHLGSCRKVDYETALQKAWKLKAKALGMSAN